MVKDTRVSHRLYVPRPANMEHSAAIMEDAGKAIDGQDKPSGSVNVLASNDSPQRLNDDEQRTNNYNRRKRKGDFGDARMQHGSRRGGRDDHKRHKKGDMGRAEYLYALTSSMSFSARH